LPLRGSSGGVRGPSGQTKTRALPHHRKTDLFAGSSHTIPKATERHQFHQGWVGRQAGGELKPSTDAQDLRDLTAKTADEHLANFQPAPGQGVLIEAGTVHSLGDGVMVFEVQENSDATFRVYDWDHVDAKTGKPRDLQVDKALACFEFDQGAITPVQPIVQSTAPVRRETLFRQRPLPPVAAPGRVGFRHRCTGRTAGRRVRG
jgi:hypothetical protein